MPHIFTNFHSAPVNADPFESTTFGIYRFNDYTDSSGHGNNLNSGANNSLVTSPTVFYSSLSVPVGTGAVSVTSPGFNMSGDFTMEGWIYLTAYAVGVSGAKVTNTVFGTRLLNTSGCDLAINTNGTIIQTTIGTGASGTAGISAATSIGLNTWYHLALVRSGSTMKIYVNGSSVGSSTNSTNWQSPAVSMGALNWQASSPTNYRPLVGYLNNVRLTTAARYTANFTPPAAL